MMLYGNDTCKNSTLCGTCNDNGRPTWCIMDKGWRTDLETCSKDDIFCSDCTNDILAHLNQYHCNAI